MTAGFRGARAWRAPCAAVALILAGCATVPQRSPSEWMAALPPDATLYASLSIPGSADLIRRSLKDAGTDFQDVSTLVDMSSRLVGSVTLARGSAARFSVVALGNYPSGIIGLRLGADKEWKKASSPSGTWWEWSKAGLQLGLPNNGILLASNGGVEELLSRWSSPPLLAVPPDVADDMRTGDLVVYMPELPGGLRQNAARSDLNIPIQEVWLKAVRTKGGYTVSGTANTQSEREAKLMTLVFRLGIVAWMRSENIPDGAARLKSITVTAQGVQVKLGGLALGDAEIIPVFLSLVKGLSPEPAAPAPEAAPEEGQDAAGTSNGADPGTGSSGP